MRVADRGYSDGVRSLQVMVESPSAGSRLEIQEGRVMELKNFLFNCSGRSWRKANWVRVRLSATS